MTSTAQVECVTNGGFYPLSDSEVAQVFDEYEQAIEYPLDQMRNIVFTLIPPDQRTVPNINFLLLLGHVYGIGIAYKKRPEDLDRLKEIVREEVESSIGIGTLSLMKGILAHRLHPDTNPKVTKMSVLDNSHERDKADWERELNHSTEHHLLRIEPHDLSIIIEPKIVELFFAGDV